jgi:hypothetical protein
LAVLDAIMSPEWEWRYFSFDAQWSHHQEMASMRNGSGDEYSIVFASAGVYIRGFDHESALSPWAQHPRRVVEGLIDRVPAVFREHVDEPAFSMDGVPSITVCVWRQTDSDVWEFGEPTEVGLQAQDGGASWLFAELDGDPATYKRFADDYYETDVPLAQVAMVFDRAPVTAELVGELNPEADITAVAEELAALPY